MANDHVQLAATVVIESDDGTKPDLARLVDSLDERLADASHIIKGGVHTDDDVELVLGSQDIPNQDILDHGVASFRCWPNLNVQTSRHSTTTFKFVSSAGAPDLSKRSMSTNHSPL